MARVCVCAWYRVVSGQAEFSVPLSWFLEHERPHEWVETFFSAVLTVRSLDFVLLCGGSKLDCDGGAQI